jgi:hypothetical protein
LPYPIRIEFPEENPTIDDIKQYYGVGEVFETNCTSNSSIPPAKLEWWINDMPMYNAEYTIKYSTIVDPTTNRETSILGLRLPLTNEHFYRGRVKVSGTKKKSFRILENVSVHTLSLHILESMERIDVEG